MDLRTIQAEIEGLGGELAWRTKWGLGVSFAGTSLRDADLWELTATLPWTVWLDLSDTTVTDAGLAILKSAVRLEALSVDGAQVTTNGLLMLRGLSKLVSITVGDTAITSAQVLWLRRLGLRADVECHRRGPRCGWFPGFRPPSLAGAELE
ncbi:MAG: hypothetical protein SH850_00290 [Planctomycetaceae bacterium]|nr:hypothetical protein [Planctomycetaceae bacterium]